MAHRRLSRVENQARTRERLLEAAARLFARRGFLGASLEDVAEEAGFSKGAVYSNFSCKDDLLLVLFELRCRESVEDAERALAGPGPIGARIQQIGDRIAARIVGDRDWTLLTIEFWSRSVRDPRLGRQFAAMWEETRSRLADRIEEQAQVAGVSPALRPDQLAAAVLGLTSGLALQMLVDPERVRPETVGAALSLLVSVEQPFSFARREGEANGRGPTGS